MNDILDALRAEVPVELARRNPPELLRQVGRGSCVQATRVGIEALNYFGVKAKPLTVMMICGNNAWAEWMKLDTFGSEQMPDEAWSVGIDPVLRPGERGFPGHLVIEVDGQLLDLDAGFYSRPDRGIHIPETVLVPLSTDPTVLGNGNLAGIDLDDGGVILYGQHHGAPDFRTSGAWRDTAKWAGPVIRRMRDRLEASP